MSVYAVKVNGRTVVTTEHLPHLFARIHDLRNAGGPVTVEDDGREMTALEVEELMLSYHAGTESAQEREWCEGNEEAGPFNLTAAHGRDPISSY